MKTEHEVDIRRIARDLIDPPGLAMRESMLDEGLEALAESLERHGQLQNIGVIVQGDRFRIAYGHRRYVASGIARMTELWCRVFPAGTTDEEAIKVDENAEQEPVNAASQATYFRELLDERCHGDVEKLARMVRRKMSFVLNRLDLTRGDPDVLAALRADRISIALAGELNKVPQQMYRRMWLHDACTHGMSVRNLRVLRENLARSTHQADGDAHAGDAPVAPSTVPSLVSMDACAFCQSTKDQREMRYVKVHESCLNVWNRQQDDRRRGGVDDERGNDG